jgi:hypothetical protein
MQRTTQRYRRGIAGAVKPVDRAYWCFTHIVDAKGARRRISDHQILNGEPHFAVERRRHSNRDPGFPVFRDSEDESRLRLGASTAPLETGCRSRPAFPAD